MDEVLTYLTQSGPQPYAMIIEMETLGERALDRREIDELHTQGLEVMLAVVQSYLGIRQID